MPAGVGRGDGLRSRSMPAYVPTERIDTLAGRILATGASPGLVLALTDRDRLLDVRCYGHANPAAEEPVTRETLFPIGSISKSFTALCLLQLAERGELDLQRPVNELLPWFPVPEITVHHLLTHTGGIVMGLDELPCSPAGVLDLARVPAMPPGEHFWYSNAGYQALGYILERLTGERFWETYRRAIFEPLGMNATSGVISNELCAAAGGGPPPAARRPAVAALRPAGRVALVRVRQRRRQHLLPAAELAAYLRMLLNRGDGVARRRLVRALDRALHRQRRGRHVRLRPGRARCRRTRRGSGTAAAWSVTTR